MKSKSSFQSLSERGDAAKHGLCPKTRHSLRTPTALSIGSKSWVPSFMHRPFFCLSFLLFVGACSTGRLPEDYAGLSEAEVVAKHGYPIDRRIVAEDVIVLVFRSRFGSERFVTLVDDQVESVKHDRNLTLLKLIPIVID